jgi:hypothetical protein
MSSRAGEFHPHALTEPIQNRSPKKDSLQKQKDHDLFMYL